MSVQNKRFGLKSKQNVESVQTIQFMTKKHTHVIIFNVPKYKFLMNKLRSVNYG